MVTALSITRTPLPTHIGRPMKAYDKEKMERIQLLDDDWNQTMQRTSISPGKHKGLTIGLETCFPVIVSEGKAVP